jgi:hypothetical protein
MANGSRVSFFFASGLPQPIGSFLNACSVASSPCIRVKASSLVKIKATSTDTNRLVTLTSQPFFVRTLAAASASIAGVPMNDTLSAARPRDGACTSRKRRRLKL